MSVVAFDTLKFAEKLEAGGFTPQQAKAASQAFADASGEQLATKRDIESLKVELRAEIAAVRSDIKSSAAETKSDIVRWLVVTQIGLAGFIFAAIKFMH